MKRKNSAFIEKNEILQTKYESNEMPSNSENMRKKQKNGEITEEKERREGLSMNCTATSAR